MRQNWRFHFTISMFVANFSRNFYFVHTYKAKNEKINFNKIYELRKRKKFPNLIEQLISNYYIHYIINVTSIQYYLLYLQSTIYHYS